MKTLPAIGIYGAGLAQAKEPIGAALKRLQAAGHTVYDARGRKLTALQLSVLPTFSALSVSAEPEDDKQWGDPTEHEFRGSYMGNRMTAAGNFRQVTLTGDEATVCPYCNTKAVYLCVNGLDTPCTVCQACCTTDFTDDSGRALAGVNQLANLQAHDYVLQLGAQ